MDKAIRILVVDDEDLVRDAFCIVLGPPQFNTSCACDGEEALKKCAEQQFDVVITDLIMPNMDGLQFIKKMKETGIKTPVITISGGARIAHQDISQKALELGAKLALQKPVSRQDILFAIEQAISQ